MISSSKAEDRLYLWGILNTSFVNQIIFSWSKLSVMRTVEVKPETRNHKGFFVQEAAYNLVGIDESGWALICLDEAVCHYVDPDNLQALTNDSKDLE